MTSRRQDVKTQYSLSAVFRLVTFLQDQDELLVLMTNATTLLLITALEALPGALYHSRISWR